MAYPTQLLRTKAALGEADTLHASLQTLPAGSWPTMPEGAWDHVLLTFRIEDDEGARVPNSATADVQIVHWSGSVGGEVISEQRISDHVLREPLAAIIPPGHSFWVGTGALAGADEDAAAVRIYWTPFRKPS